MNASTVFGWTSFSMHPPPCASHATARQIETQIGDGYHLLRRLSGASRERPKSSEQHLEWKRLGEIVVSARIEAVHDVRWSVPSRQHEDWDTLARRSQPARDLESVQTRQHDVENSGDHRTGFARVHTLEGVVRQRHRMIGFLESLTQQLAHRAFVFDDQH